LADVDGDVTRLAVPNGGSPERVSSDRASGAAAASRVAHQNRPLTSSSSWLTSTEAIDHGRFELGALLDGRYRIVGRLGRGGMGEVYRADDLRLGQPVALKFLPEDVDHDPGRLTQLHAEVRMARQVSHPNVCRVYDVGEFEGHTFLSMEYVDGEDLALLLRRIGRFPQDRAIELSRQICAGLAAAHDRGVVHRDLKPANIMLDANGRIRITDFGLAGAAGEILRAGTPAYMAPEQLSGAEVTPRSDIYSLGLVLYELFTGQRALEAKNLAELIAKREQAGITPPTAIVRDLDPAIENVIFRCLEPDPARRPRSATAVTAALPGGDPIAAAIAAGETPSPEMVAAATTEALSRTTIVAAILWIALSAIALLALYQRVQLINRSPLPKPPAALIDRAQEIAQKLGYGDQTAYSAAGLTLSLDWVRYIASTNSSHDRWKQLAAPRPETQVLWYRTSPRPLIPLGDENRVEAVNPPLTTSGMTLVVVDANGRLSELLAVPQPIESNPQIVRTNWSTLFDAASLSMNAFAPVAPRWVPAVYADERMAWEGALPERPDLTVRIEAAGFAGKPVFFGITGPWTRSARTPSPGARSGLERATELLTSLIMPGLVLCAALLARRNVRLGRGDRRGAYRAATAIFFIILAAWLLSDRHVSVFSAEVNRFFGAIAQGLFAAGLLWVTYLGLEPYVRRFSPASLIGWTRLVAGGWRDPHVGRDVVIGVAAGLAMTIAYALHNMVPLLAGRPEPIPLTYDPTPLMGFHQSLGRILDAVQAAITDGMLGMAGFVAFRIVLKRTWAAALAAIACYAPVVVNGMFPGDTPMLDVAVGVVITTILVAVVAWIGLLATIAALAVHIILMNAPMTLDLSSWRGPIGLVFISAIVAAGLFGCHVASGSAQRAAPRAA
jgi:serine/threonine-protein kinase